MIGSSILKPMCQIHEIASKENKHLSFHILYFQNESKERKQNKQDWHNFIQMDVSLKS